MNNKHNNHTDFNQHFFDDKGLNIHAIINLKNVPTSILQTLQGSGIDTHNYCQLILLGHLGKKLWQKVSADNGVTNNPIDDYTLKSIYKYFENYHTATDYEIVYPGESVIGLQQLGEYSGWHYPSPFKVGINALWGSWFAYRAVVLANTNFKETKNLKTESPCNSCKDTNCISACPAKALENTEFNFQSCINYRKQPDSLCKNNCLSRIGCPVGSEYRYTDDQISYHYGVSMKTIEEFY